VWLALVSLQRLLISAPLCIVNLCHHFHVEWWQLIAASLPVVLCRCCHNQTLIAGEQTHATERRISRFMVIGFLSPPVDG
jgi:hypothetical protein